MGEEEEHPTPEVVSSPTVFNQEQTFNKLLFGRDVLEGEPHPLPQMLDLGFLEDRMRRLDKVRPQVAYKDAPVPIHGEAEVAKTIFFDLNDQTLGETETVQGDIAKVRSTALDVKEGQKAIIEVHTHSSTSLPSLVDYQLLIMGFPEHKIRILPAIMILCPGNQVLALATDQTPILIPEGASKFIKEYREKLEEGEFGPKIKSLDKCMKKDFLNI